MRCRRPAENRGSRRLGITLLIFGLVHIPLPEPDFHNIRHHDGPGEVCEHHDHLLRWHPGAGSAADVAVLHWHWFLPQPGGTEPIRQDGQPALHAHIADWFASGWSEAPRLLPDHSSRLLARLIAPVPSAVLSIIPASPSSLGSEGGMPRAQGFCATFAPRAPLNSLLQRWVC
jgi:hypothetical protein